MLCFRRYRTGNSKPPSQPPRSTMADPYVQGGGAAAADDDPLNLNSVIREVALMADKLKGDDDYDAGAAYVSPYAHLEKAAVLQEARCFNDSVVVRENPRKCCTVIAQLLHLQNTGQFLSGTEATEGEFRSFCWELRLCRRAV